jgi:hypothetical protein
MCLEEIAGHLLGELRDIAGLKRARRDDDLVGGDRPSADGNPERPSSRSSCSTSLFSSIGNSKLSA